MKKFLYLIVLLYGMQGEVYAQYAPDFITDCEKSGFIKTPRYTETVAYAQALAAASPMVHYTTFGTSPEGRDLPLLIVDKDGYTTPEEIRNSGKVVMYVEACIHSGEPDGKDAGFMLLRDMVIRKKHLHLLDGVSMLFIPIFNVDGHENFGAHNRLNQNGPEELGTRVTGQLINLNRDFLKADAPEMRDWLKLFNRWMPELFIDVHVTDGADFQYVVTYNLETNSTYMESGLRKWTVSVFEKNLKEKMAAAGFPIFPYFSFRQYNTPESGIEMEIFDPRYSQGYVAARNRVGLLVENHIYKPYKQRVLSTYELLKASAEILNEKQSELKRKVAEADRHTASADFRRQPMDFAFRSTCKDSVMVDFLGWKRITVKSDLSGGDWTKHDYNQPITVHTPLFTSFEPTISLQLPEAYLLMPQWKNIVEILDLHGVRYRPLEKAGTLSVQTYRYTKAAFATRQSEGRIPVKTEYSVQTEEMDYPAGSLLIDMNQPSARIVAWLLEPAAPGSLTYWGFLNSVVQAPGEFWIGVPYMEVKGREMLAKDPELKKEFEAKKAYDPGFASNPSAILRYFYDKVKRIAHTDNDVHPAWRIMDRQQVEKLQ